jgi:hypothetical protein
MLVATGLLAHCGAQGILKAWPVTAVTPLAERPVPLGHFGYS